jgi:hypothetical protein
MLKVMGAALALEEKASIAAAPSADTNLGERFIVPFSSVEVFFG